jgi:hypothetical protein
MDMVASYGTFSQTQLSHALRAGTHVSSLCMGCQGAPSHILWRIKLVQILSRYPGFYRKLKMSPSKEVRMLLKMVESDPRSTTCQNLRYLRKGTKLENAEQYSSWRIRKELPLKCVPEPEK